METTEEVSKIKERYLGRGSTDPVRPFFKSWIGQWKIPLLEKHPKVRAIPIHDYDTYLADVALKMFETTGTHYSKMDHFKKLKYNSGRNHL